MSEKYRFHDQNQPYFVSFAVINWIDLFIRDEYRNILLESWKYCIEHKGLIVHAWCIMTSHVHLIISTQQEKLEDILRDTKSFTSHALRSAIAEHPQESRREWIVWMMEREGKRNKHNKGFQLWQQSNHAIELRTEAMKKQKMDYIHQNPVIAGFVTHPEHYLYSSASDYCGKQGLLHGIQLM